MAIVNSFRPQSVLQPGGGFFFGGRGELLQLSGETNLCQVSLVDGKLGGQIQLPPHIDLQIPKKESGAMLEEFASLFFCSFCFCPELNYV